MLMAVGRRRSAVLFCRFRMKTGSVAAAAVVMLMIMPRGRGQDAARSGITIDGDPFRDGHLSEPAWIETIYFAAGGCFRDGSRKRPCMARSCCTDWHRRRRLTPMCGSPERWLVR